MPLDERDERLDPVRTLVRNAEIQRAAIAYCREMSETAATRLGDYGISIITSSKRGHNDARARVELLSVHSHAAAEELSQLLAAMGRWDADMPVSHLGAVVRIVD